jgi:hypothetical protein
MRVPLLIPILALASCGTRTVDPCSGIGAACIALQISSTSIQRLDGISLHISSNGVDTVKMAALPGGAAFALPVALAISFDTLTGSTPQQIDLTASGSLKGVVQGTGSASVKLTMGQHSTAQVILAPLNATCSACPAVANATVTCAGTPPTCDYQCNSGTHDCGGGQCLDNSSTSSCGGSCSACPIPSNAIATCDGHACGFSCITGFHACNGACVDDTSTDNCGTLCTPCPKPAQSTPTCNGTQCSFSCNGGYVSVGLECLMCGGMGQPCCTGNICNNGFGCAMGSCGSPWTLSPALNTGITAVWGSSATDVYAVSSSGNIYHSSTGISGFTVITTLGGNAFRSIWGSGPNDIYVVGASGSGGSIYHNTGGPSGTWSPATTTDQLSAVWGSGPGDIFVAGGTNLYHSPGGGAAFTPQPVPASFVASVLWGSGPGDVYAAGDLNGLAHYTTANGWQTVTGLGSSRLIALGGSSASDIYVGGFHYLAHWDGNAWSSVSLPSTLSGNFIAGIWSSAPNDVYVVSANAGAIGHWDGKQWANQLLPSGLPGGTFFSGVWGSAANDVYIVSNSTYLLHNL